jgi:exonuclease III
MRLNYIIYLFSLFCNQVISDSECYTVPSISSDRRVDKTKLRIVQYNVEWLFIDYYASSNCPGSGCTWVNQTEAETHLDYVSNVIKDLNPDIINFCEIEGCDELNMLIENLDSSYKPYLKKGTDSSTGQNVGMLTRIDPIVNLYRTEDRFNYPIEGSKCGYTGQSSNTGVSKHYITEYVINNIKIAFITAHLLAFPTDPTRCAEREAQAMVLQNVINNYTIKGYEIIFMGDLNDFDGTVIDANNNIPTSKVLELLKGDGKYELFSISENIVQSERYTDWYDENNNCKSSSNEFSMIDHILVSDRLRNSIVNSYIYHGYDEYCGKYNSDHFPVVIDLLL